MKFKDSNLILSRIILPLIALSILAVSYLRMIDNYELETLDLRFALRPLQKTTDDLVLIEIGDDTLKNLGSWPIERNFHALLINALSQSGARAIIFDIFFSEPKEYDNELANAIRDAKNVYLPFIFELETGKKASYARAKGYVSKNLAVFSSVDKGEGCINIIPDIDGKFRRIPLLVKYKDDWYPYISFLATCDYLGIPIKEIKIVPGRYISCGPSATAQGRPELLSKDGRLKIPLDDSSNMIVNFSGRWGKSYKHYSYSDIVQSYLAHAIGQKPILDLSVFKDKVCIVGLTAAGAVDLHPNPIEPLYPGFSIHAEMLNSMINNRFIARASKETNLLILIILSAIIAIATLRSKPVTGLISLILSAVIFSVLSVLLFNATGLWIDMFYPVIVMALLYLLLTLYKYIAEWKKRLILENELGIAKKIQEGFLPRSLPEIRGLEMDAAMFTARQVGGDLYDFRIFSGDKIGVMIGDVSGKGVPASLFMAMVTSEFKFFAKPDCAPQDVLSTLNSELVRESSSNLFVTMFYIIFDMKRNKAKYSNGGHLPAIHLNHESKTGLLDTSEGTPLGLIDSQYNGKEIAFKKDDILVLYTDGVTEAMNNAGQMYGQDRLTSVIKSGRDLKAKELLKTIEKDIRNFEPESKQHDDITLIVIKIT
jgi:CHASE2 domain-containing sensor protein